MVNGIKQKPIEGVSMAYTFDAANANAPSKRDTQYFEMFANRAIYHDGWIATTTPPQAPGLQSCLAVVAGGSLSAPRARGDRFPDPRPARPSHGPIG